MGITGKLRSGVCDGFASLAKAAQHIVRGTACQEALRTLAKTAGEEGQEQQQPHGLAFLFCFALRAA